MKLEVKNYLTSKNETLQVDDKEALQYLELYGNNLEPLLERRVYPLFDRYSMFVEAFKRELNISSVCIPMAKRLDNKAYPVIAFKQQVGEVKLLDVPNINIDWKESE